MSNIGENQNLLLNYFDYEEIIEFRNIFKDLQENMIIKNSKYDDNKWCLYDDFKHENRYINFNLNSLLYKKMPEVLEFLKAWVIQSLSEGFSIAGVQSKLHNVLIAINTSHYFNLKFFKNFKLTYLNSKLGSTLIAERVSDVLLFIDFLDEEIEGSYIELLIQLNSTLKRSNNVRKLPSTKDILKFSLCVEDFFSRNLEESIYYKYFPIYLWWKITNIIPMRIAEFCNIPIDCIEYIDDKYYLVFKRGKLKKQRIKKIDKIPIPESIAELILNYRSKCGKNNKLGQLVYFIPTVHSPVSGKIFKKNTPMSYFTASDFDQILQTFYSLIIKDEYGYSIEDSSDFEKEKSISRKIRPNDTRHFAFLNLMLQGYHPSQIARLGGHSSIYSQYSYHNHVEHWVDSDVAFLILSQNNNHNKITSIFSNDLIIKEKINLFENVNETRIELEVGYCIDPHQNCLVDNHFVCSKWRIDHLDYIKNQHIIENSLKANISVFETIIDKLFDLHKTTLFNSKSELYQEKNPLFKVKLTEYAKSVRQSILNINRVKGIINNAENWETSKENT